MADRTLTTNTQANTDGVPNFASGKWVSDAGSNAVNMTFTLGFTPRFVRFFNVTDILMHEWYDGMAADYALLTTGSTGAVTVLSSNAITVNDGTNATTGRGFTVNAALVPASKTGYWIAHG